MFDVTAEDEDNPLRFENTPEMQRDFATNLEILQNLKLITQRFIVQGGTRVQTTQFGTGRG